MAAAPPAVVLAVMGTPPDPAGLHAAVPARCERLYVYFCGPCPAPRPVPMRDDRLRSLLACRGGGRRGPWGQRLLNAWQRMALRTRFLYFSCLTLGPDPQGRAWTSARLPCCRAWRPS